MDATIPFLVKFYPIFMFTNIQVVPKLNNTMYLNPASIEQTMSNKSIGYFNAQTNKHNPAPNKCELAERVASQDTVPYIII